MIAAPANIGMCLLKKRIYFSFQVFTTLLYTLLVKETVTDPTRVAIGSYLMANVTLSMFFFLHNKAKQLTTLYIFTRKSMGSHGLWLKRRDYRPKEKSNEKILKSNSYLFPMWFQFILNVFFFSWVTVIIFKILCVTILYLIPCFCFVLFC